jgi:two-component system sensor histidine kinase KdpD
MQSKETRPDPDALLLAATREAKGHLKVFLGAAPGVGKTWEMLASAQRAAAEGRDVLIGVVETHGRAGTERQIGDLPILPRRTIAYRGQVLEEFDVDAALARLPGLLLVDELAHTNAPGSRHNKRWEDVAELLDAGIDIWATLNVQHLESLNDDVARITGVRVTETLPDRVLEMADEIEFIDLSPAELRARLKDGQIYRPDVAARALQSFFREGNLAALREIGLRRAAQRVDQDVRDYMRQHAVAGPWPAGDRVLALVGADSAAESVVRQAKRLADALRAPWLALHVERLDGVEVTRPALDMAAGLGAEIEIRAGGHLVRATLEVARARNVTHLVIGRGRPSLLRRLFGQTLAGTLVRQGPEFALHVVPVSGTAAPARRLNTMPKGWIPWVVSTGLVGSVVGAGQLLHPWLEHEALGMMFLAAVVAAAAVWGLPIALYTAAVSFLCWNFFFIPPVGHLTIREPRDVIAILVFLGVAAATGWLASRVRLEAQAAQGRIESLRRISAFSRRLGEPVTEPDLLAEVARLAAEMVSPALVLIVEGEDLNIRAARPASQDTMDEGSWAAARWSFSRQEPAGRGTATLPGASWRFLPLRTAREAFGCIGVRPAPGPGGGLDQPLLQSLLALADQAATSLERVRLTAAAARTEAQAETQKLRTALLNSLSHDLRTPLTGIRGAAGSLRTSWETLAAADRTDLLASIEQDIVRMTRFLANITEMTRLESGEVAPRLEPVPVQDAAAGAAARVPGLNALRLDIPDGLAPVIADPALLEQVMVNLLENAVKYGAKTGEVTLSARRSGPEIAISVSDTGPGIPAEELPHIFNSFYRARREDRTVPGTGLGLAIARGLTEAMGGTIEAVSPGIQPPGANARASDGPGATVTLRLPAAP